MSSNEINPLYQGPEKRIAFSIETAHLLFFLLFFLTLCNGFYNSLNVAYRGDHSTFLCSPDDLYGDLIKSSISLPPFPESDFRGWKPLYVRYFKENPYRRLEDIKNGQLTVFHAPPIDFLYYASVKWIVFKYGPNAAVLIFHSLCLLGIACLARTYARDFKESVYIFGVVALSYPSLMVLTRGSGGSIVPALCLIYYLTLLFYRQRPYLAAVFLAIALNVRPNTIVFLPGLLVYGWRNAVKATAACALIAGAIYFECFEFTKWYCPGYKISIFLKALNIYYELGTFTSACDAFNNSLFSAFKWIVDGIFGGQIPNYNVFFSRISLFCGVITFILMITSVLAYLKDRLNRFEFLFTLFAIYVLGSNIIATYHLFTGFFFLLILVKNAGTERLGRHWLLISLTSIFVLVPKNYLFANNISFEAFLNPIVLLIGLLALFAKTLWFHPIGAPNTAKIPPEQNVQRQFGKTPKII